MCVGGSVRQQWLRDQPLIAHSQVMTSKRDVRILLLGDRGVGKTSLILSLISEEFLDEVPFRAEEITIPPDVTAQHVPTHIVDFSFEEQKESDLVEEMCKAHVACLVVSLDDVSSVNSAREYWLPTLNGVSFDRQLSPLPVILVGNKSDLVNPELLISTHIEPMMSEFPNIETFVACSARDLSNVSEVFHYAQKAVLHPSSPLFNYDISELTMTAVRCLHRVFRLCDLDNDGLLNDSEINLLQVRAFGAPLDAINLHEVKSIIDRNCPEGLVHNSISETGFLFLNALFIQRGRIETTWSILRSFGYGDDLNIKPEILEPPVNAKPGSSVELSSFGVDFLTALFQKHDKDRDGCLSPAELNDLFDVCPRAVPWGGDVMHSVATNVKGWPTLPGFLAQWTLTTYLDTPRMLEYLAYFGYSERDSTGQSTAIRVTRPKHEDLATRTCTRSVLLCHVIGPQGAGKSSFLQGLLNRTVRDLRSLDFTNELSRYAINAVPTRSGSTGGSKYLLMHDFDVELRDALNDEDLDCDVIVLMYDASDPTSFNTIASLYLTYLSNRTPPPASPPVLVCGAKSDRSEVVQNYPLSPAQFCSQHRLPPPVLVSCWDTIKPDVYTTLVSLATNPHKRYRSSDREFWTKAVVAGGVFALGAFLVYRIYRSQ